MLSGDGDEIALTLAQKAFCAYFCDNAPKGFNANVVAFRKLRWHFIKPFGV